MKLSRAVDDVFSGLFVELSGFLLVSTAGYITAQDWPRLTVTIFLCILTIWAATKARQQTYDKS
jgi:hypothetical protein